MYYISKAAAQEIVEEIGAEIRENINMMDAKGVIIASTDPSRIGQVHEGARRIISEGLDALYISEAMETETTKRGINLALKVNGEIAGVVGITGEESRVIGYGNIVRRMTEIMILDSSEKDARRYDRRVRYRFIEEWISRSDGSYSRSFIERGLHLGIDVQRKYRVMMICFPDYGQLSDTLDGQQLLEEMESSIRHEMERNQNPYLREPPRQICLMPPGSDETLRAAACRVASMIKKKYNHRIVVGFDGAGSADRTIRQRYLEAGHALNHAMLWEQDQVFYDSMDIELFLSEIPDSVMREYLGKLFDKIPGDELDDTMRLIESYFAYEGSITQMSDKMYMHKNTLQYKIKKLTGQTGKDIRLPSNAAVYYMALCFYRKLKHHNEGYRQPVGHLV